MKLIILDRDGVINQDSDSYIRSPEEWVPLPASLAAIALLARAGYRIGVATNQSGIARGLFDRQALDLMHDKMRNLLRQRGGRIDYLTFCPHGPEEGCGCRKPQPGMLLEICRHFATPPGETTMVGDSLTDYQAATRAGMRFALVLTGKGRRTLEKGKLPSSVAVHSNLHEFVKNLLQ